MPELDRFREEDYRVDGFFQISNDLGYSCYVNFTGKKVTIHIFDEEIEVTLNDNEGIVEDDGKIFITRKNPGFVSGMGDISSSTQIPLLRYLEGSEEVLGHVDSIKLLLYNIFNQEK